MAGTRTFVTPDLPRVGGRRRRGSAIAPDDIVVVEYVTDPGAAAVLARWGADLARLGRERQVAPAVRTAAQPMSLTPGEHR